MQVCHKCEKNDSAQEQIRLEMACQIEDLEKMPTSALKDAQIQSKQFKGTQREFAKVTTKLNNLHIKNDLQTSHLQTKIKLLEDALNNRNQDIELAEDNNQ